MDIAQHRRRVLRNLIDTRFDKVARHLAIAIGKPEGQINDMLAGRKSFGEKVARQIENKLELGIGYFDLEHQPLNVVNEPARVIYGQFNELISSVISIMTTLSPADQSRVLDAAKFIENETIKTRQNSTKRAGT